MVNTILDHSFFKRNTTIVARDLLGKFLVRRTWLVGRQAGKEILSGMIVETEAYIGPHDLACHASKGKTERTKVMFEAAGTWYVYMIYGMYYCLNIVTEAKDYPSAVLIRALEPAADLQLKTDDPGTEPGASLRLLTNGPGKLCRALKIDKKLNCTSAVAPKAKLYIEERGIKIPKNKIIKTKRVGVDYAGEWKNKKLRFYIRGNEFVSSK